MNKKTKLIVGGIVAAVGLISAALVAIFAPNGGTIALMIAMFGVVVTIVITT